MAENTEDVTFECHTKCFARANGAELYRKIKRGPDKGKTLQGHPSLVNEGDIKQTVERSSQRHFHKIVAGVPETTTADIDTALSQSHQPGREDSVKAQLDELDVKYQKSWKLETLEKKLAEKHKELADKEQEELDKLNENV